MNFWDTQCHLFQEYYDDIERILEEAKCSHVTGFIVSGCDTKSNYEVMSLVSNHLNCYGVVGIHPEEADRYSDDDILKITEFCKSSKIVGIGEIGLDYHYTKENKESQRVLFEKQLKIAEEFHLPVVIHSREATEDTINILKNYKVKGVIHSFSGSLEVAKIYMKMGFLLGINGVVTFKNSKLIHILPSILDSIVLETDSPYLTPHPYRGQKNSPKYIQNIAEFIALSLNISIRQVEKVTNKNVFRIFDKIYRK